MMGETGAEIELSAAEARGAALAAQGMGRPRPNGRVDVRHLRRAIDDVGLLQLDSVNVFCRSHYMPLFSRLGPYPRATLDRLAAHADTAAGPATRAGRDRPCSSTGGTRLRCCRSSCSRCCAGGWRGRRSSPRTARRWSRRSPSCSSRCCARCASGGRSARPTSPRRCASPRNPWFNWSEGKVALDYLFFAGRVCAAHRVSFERRYDLPERVLPDAVLDAPTPAEDEAQRQLLLIAAARLGVATEPDLGDYFRLPRAESKARLAELVEAGALTPTRVEGWSAPAYVAAGRPPTPAREARALLTPFDPLVWSRPRTERLFGFRYRIEIYTPAAKRVHGYYVLPFLLGDRLVARVDVKSDRQAGVLRVLGAFAEPGADPGAVAPELADELRLLAGWLELERVSVARNGDLAGKLAKAI